VEPKERLLKKLETDEGRIPFDEWYLNLKDKKARAVVAARLLRIQAGNFGDVKPIALGVYEFRIDFGPGYRIYFGEVHNILVVLLCGGDKSTQKRDIDRAIALWSQCHHEIERHRSGDRTVEPMPS
jgi:putative addiction module killer protein